MNERYKQLIAFIFFLMLSAVFWLILTLNETYEREVKIPMQVTNVPKNVVLTSANVDTVRVTIRDKGWQLMSYIYGEKLKAIPINFKNYDRGTGGGIVSSSELKRIIEQHLALSSRVTSLKPEKLEFFYNNGERKRVAVQWAGRVIPEELYFISHIRYQPDSVDVYASREKLDSIRVVYSEPLNYVGFRDSLNITCQLVHQNDVKLVPDKTHITFYTDVLTEENIEVPIQCINLPEGVALKTFPSKVSVHFVAGANQILELTADEFSVIADYNEIQQHANDRCKIYLVRVPEGVSRATLSVKYVDYLIEEE